MKRLYVFMLIAICAQYTCYGQTDGRLFGQVLGESGIPLVGASALILESGVGTLTDSTGSFLFTGLKPGRATIKISYVGYNDVVEKLTIASSVLSQTMIRLSPNVITGDELIVTALRRPEKLTQSPSAVALIKSVDLENTAGFNPNDLTSKLQGVEFVRTGVVNSNINARGFNNAYNTKVLQLTDGRNSMLAGANGLPPGMMNTVIKEDIDHLEIVLGPNSALYGPNAHNGILNTITKDPRKYEGTTIALTAGNQQVVSGRLRHASKINTHWAYKLTAEYTTGRDFDFKDSVYAGGGVFGPAVSIPERIPSYQFKYIKGEAHVYYNFRPQTYVVIAYGRSNNTFMNVTNLTRNQQKDWNYTFLQGRYVSPRLFVQLYETWADAGETYGISSYTRDFWNRTHSTITDPLNPAYANSGYLPPDQAEVFALRAGNVFKEKSRRSNAEIQYNHEFEKIGLLFIASSSYQRDLPNTYGSILVDAVQKVKITQYGIALHAEKKLPSDIRLITAVRLDHHNLFGKMVSPKIAISKQLGNGSLRLTWGRAFASPIILFQRASVFGLIFGNGNGVSYLPNGANFNDASAVAMTKAIRPEQINTFEAGFKGLITPKLYLDVSTYYGQSRNFLSPAISVGGRALAVGNFPIDLAKLLYPGTIEKNGTLTGAAFSTYFNYGQVHSYGTDLSLSYNVSQKLGITLKYSWFGSDITKNDLRNDANRDGYVALDERSLNAPKNRLWASVFGQDLFGQRLFASISMRFVQGYDMYSGSQLGTKAGEGKRGVVFGGENPLTNQPRYYVKNFDHGQLGGFVSFDISAGCKLSNMVNLNGSVSNVFNTRQIEFVASPSIGRLYALELRVHISGKTQ